MRRGAGLRELRRNWARGGRVLRRREEAEPFGQKRESIFLFNFFSKPIQI